MGNKIENQLEQDIREHRAMGEHGGVQHTTTFNRVITIKLGDLLEDLELLSGCRRKTGGEAVFPLRSHAVQPVCRDAVEQKMQEIEQDFQTAGQNGRGVYGIPFNHPYWDGDPSKIWEEVRNSRILELGGERSEYALKVRVFPYACRTLSVWVFVACSMRD